MSVHWNIIQDDVIGVKYAIIANSRIGTVYHHISLWVVLHIRAGS